jgi:MFS family permease
MLCAFVTSFSFSAYSLLLPAFLQEFHWARSAAVLPFSLAMVVWGVMQPLTGALADRRGTRPLILGGILCSTLGFVTLGTAQSLWQIALGFGVLIGTANSACGSMMWALLIAKWFPGARRAAPRPSASSRQPRRPPRSSWRPCCSSSSPSMGGAPPPWAWGWCSSSSRSRWRMSLSRTRPLGHVPSRCG